MPTYEYICLDCKERIEIRASISEKEKGLKVICPKCKSSKTARVFRNIMVLKGSGSNSTPPICGPRSGPGCCG